MILTFKVKHGRDFSRHLANARKVAEFGVRTGARSSKDVSQFGLPSAISNQILKKYRKAKRVTRVKLVVPGQGIKIRSANTLWISCLRLELTHFINRPFSKVNQVELGPEFAYISVTVQELPEATTERTLGIDCNATGHCVVASCPETGTVLKLGKKAPHTHKKYKAVRRRFQTLGKLREVKKVKNRESHIVRDLNHKMSRKVVNTARELNAHIVMEDLTSIRKRAKTAKSFRGALHSWSYFQFQTFVEYKAKLLGIPVRKIDPRYTSQQCSRCGRLGTRNGKSFRCECGHVANADVNASFVIALRHTGGLQLPVAKDVGKGSTDTPKRQRRGKTTTLEPHRL